MTSRADLEIYQGDDYAATVFVTNSDDTPADLTGYTAKAQIRRQVAALDSNVVAEFTTAVVLPDQVAISLTHDQTAPLGGKYVWDLQLTAADGIITTILYGGVVVTPEVTRLAEAAVAMATSRRR